MVRISMIPSYSEVTYNRRHSGLDPESSLISNCGYPDVFSEVTYKVFM